MTHNGITQGPLPELHEAEMLCRDLKTVLIKSEKALEKSDLRNNVEKVEQWLESYRRGLSAARKIGTSGIEMLQKVRDGLHFSLDEYLRLENEGGNLPANEYQNDYDELTSAIKRLDHLVKEVEHSFAITADTREPEMATAH